MENLKIKGRIWLETESGLKIGLGRVKLLEQIHELSSMSEAAKRLNIPYRKVWGIVKEMNGNSSEMIVIKEVGGKSGGKSVLTDYGKQLIEKFRIVDESFQKFTEEEFKNQHLTQ